MLKAVSKMVRFYWRVKAAKNRLLDLPLLILLDLAQKNSNMVPQITRIDQTEHVFISSTTGEKLPTVDCLGRQVSNSERK